LTAFALPGLSQLCHTDIHPFVTVGPYTVVKSHFLDKPDLYRLINGVKNEKTTYPKNSSVFKGVDF